MSEQALEQPERVRQDDALWLRSFVRHAPWSIVVWRIEGPPGRERPYLVSANRMAHRLVGRDLDGLVGRLSSEVFPEVPLDDELRIVAGSGAVRKLTGIQVRGVIADLMLLGLPGGFVAVVLEPPFHGGVNDDGGGMLADFYHRAPCGFHALDAEGRFLRVNDTELGWLGYSREELLGRPLRELVHPPERRQPFFEAYREEVVQRGRRRQGIEVQLRRKDGSIATFLLGCQPHHDAAGRFVYASASALDITSLREAEEEKARAHDALQRAKDDAEERVEQRTRELRETYAALARSEDQLRQAQKMEAIGRLAGGVAHDFNNMLCAILGFASAIHDELPEGSALRSDARQIRLAGERAAALTRQLLIFSRREVVRPTLIDVGAALRDLAGMLRCLLGDAVELDMLLAPDLPPVRLDRGHFDQVVLNLAVNARDAMPAGGKLTIEASEVLLDGDEVARSHGARAGRHVRFSISDTGVGMDASTQGRIFEPFFSTKAPGEGTGLGLATVHGIVAGGHGSIRVESEPGKGTTFRVHFPVAAAQAEGACEEGPAQRECCGETILLVEDDEQVRRVAASILKKQGYQVHTAKNGIEALSIAAESPGPLHLVVTDMVMPAMSGRDLAARMSVIRPGTPVLFMSGYIDEATLRRGIADAVINYLQKPFTPASLSWKVRDVIDRHQLVPS